MTQNQKISGVAVSVLLALLSLLISGAVGYTSNDKQIEHRLTVVEEGHAAGVQLREDDRERIIRIEDKLDRLIERVK